MNQTVPSNPAVDQGDFAWVIGIQSACDGVRYKGHMRNGIAKSGNNFYVVICVDLKRVKTVEENGFI